MQRGNLQYLQLLINQQSLTALQLAEKQFLSHDSFIFELDLAEYANLSTPMKVQDWEHGHIFVSIIHCFVLVGKQHRAMLLLGEHLASEKHWFAHRAQKHKMFPRKRFLLKNKILLSTRRKKKKKKQA